MEEEKQASSGAAPTESGNDASATGTAENGAKALGAKLKATLSRSGITVQSITVGVAVIVVAIVLFWLIDKLFLYYTTKSYVDELVEAFDLNRHLARGLIVASFVVAAIFLRNVWSFSKYRRMFGIAGVAALLIGHSVAMWYATRNNYFDRSGAAVKCYVLSRDGKVTYGEHEGIDPATGRLCRPVTAEMLERLQQYEQGKRPSLISERDPTFFDPRTGEPIVWYYRSSNGELQLFDLMGFHPETGEELSPVTKQIVELWKTQTADAKKRIPKPVDPASFVFFDPRNGTPRAWYWLNAEGKYEFFDSPGFHPRTGDALKVVTGDVLDSWKKASSRRAAPKPVDPTSYAFFDPATGAPRVWYWLNAEGKYEFFDSPGFHPRTGDALKIVNGEVIDSWKKATSRRAEPKRVEPSSYAFFDPATGAPRVWYWHGEDGSYEFYDAPGFHPRTGDKLEIVTRDVFTKWKQETERPKRIEAPPQPRADSTALLEGKAKAFLYSYMSSSSAENATALGYAARVFASNVEYFGRRMSGREVLEDKKSFMTRWPDRNYRINPESVRLNCNANESYCDVSSEFQFRAYNPGTGKVSSGVASNRIRVLLVGNDPQILSENGTVISRNIEDVRIDPRLQPGGYSGPGAPQQPQNMTPEQTQQMMNGFIGIMRQLAR